MTVNQEPTSRSLELSSGKATVKRRHYKSFLKIKVYGVMNKVRVILSQIMRSKMSLGWTGRLVVVSGNSMAGILVKKRIKSKAQI